MFFHGGREVCQEVLFWLFIFLLSLFRQSLGDFWKETGKIKDKETGIAQKILSPDALNAKGVLSCSPGLA
jgi:hypothetical protein